MEYIELMTCRDTLIGDRLIKDEDSNRYNILVPDHYCNSKSWKIPSFSGGAEFFFENVFSILPAWREISIYPRLTTWHLDVNSENKSNSIYYYLLKLLGMNLDCSKSIKLDNRESGLGALILSLRSIYGNCIDSDTFVISNDLEFIVNISHHNYITLHFKYSEIRDNFDFSMNSFEYEFIDWC